MTKAPTKLVAKPPRRLKQSKYSSFKLQRKIKPVTPKLPNSFKIMHQALQTLKKNWKVFTGIMVIYGLLTLVLVRGLSLGSDFDATRDSLESSLGGNSPVVSGVILFAYLLGANTGTAGTGAAGVFQIVFVLVASLALVWTLRQAQAGGKIRIRDGFYLGMYPLVPFVLVLCVVLLQLVPFVLGGFLYGVVSGNMSITGPEMLVWTLLLFALAILSLYMVASSIFALFIACLPNMQPIAALRSARELVRYRRWTVLRKMLFLPLVLVLVLAAIMIPVIIWIPVTATWIFFVLALFALPVIHSYLYRLYRELL